jgi:molecular chaperone DnaK
MQDRGATPSIVPVGIDLGTSFCAASYIDASGSSQMIANEEGQRLTPSVVHFSDSRVEVGRKAWDAALVAPDRVAENAKRDMGLSSYRQQIGGQDYPPEVIQGCILRQLRRDIIAAVGENFHAVITVPAYFDEGRRKATCDAAIMSGIPVLDIVNEPTAAALSFGELLGYLTPEGAPKESLNVLVYDLGGGTFDVTVIRLAGDEVRTLATDGDCELGGVNWDQRLAEHAESRFRAVWTDAAPLKLADKIRLLRVARDVKHALSAHPAALFEFKQGEKEVKLPITREEFEDLAADLLERTAFTTKQAMLAGGLMWSELDRLLLVGGSSRMPAVRRALKEISGIAPDDAVHPDEAVARGAAIFARYLLGVRGIAGAAPQLRISDVNSHGLGIEGVNLQTLRAENVTLIRRNTPLPCEIKRTFVTRADNQPNVKIQLLEGESSLPGQCSQLATVTIKNLPPGLPKGTSIDVRYSLQSNGLLEVTAAVPTHGENAKIELQRERGLTDNRVQRWKRIVCRDGGYRDFQDAWTSLLMREDGTETESVDADSQSGGPADAKAKPSLEPAVEFGAPRAAADTLQTQFRSPSPSSPAAPAELEAAAPAVRSAGQNAASAIRLRRKQAKRRFIVNSIGHVLAALFGLSLGYYALCWVRPDLNFLNLKLPGVRTIDDSR